MNRDRVRLCTPNILQVQFPGPDLAVVVFPQGGIGNRFGRVTIEIKFKGCAGNVFRLYNPKMETELMR